MISCLVAFVAFVMNFRGLGRAGADKTRDEGRAEANTHHERCVEDIGAVSKTRAGEVMGVS